MTLVAILAAVDLTMLDLPFRIVLECASLHHSAPTVDTDFAELSFERSTSRPQVQENPHDDSIHRHRENTTHAG